jgi:hypothetical protein
MPLSIPKRRAIVAKSTVSGFFMVSTPKSNAYIRALIIDVRPGTILARFTTADSLCVSTHSARPNQANISSKPKETRVFKFIRRMAGIVAGVAKRLPLFRPASISRELEQTLCLVRCCRQQREKAAARPPVSAA